jgi:hypothetical protein
MHRQNRQHVFAQPWVRLTLLTGGGVMGSVWGWYVLTGWADPIIVEGHVVEVAQAMLWGLSAAVATTAVAVHPTRQDRFLAAWMGLLGLLGMLREVELHRYLTGLFGVRFKSKWLLDPAVPLWVRLTWVGLALGLAVALVIPPLLLRAPLKNLLRRGDTASGLFAVAIGSLVLGYALDDLLGRGLLISRVHSQILEETFELLGAMAFLASVVAVLHRPLSVRMQTIDLMDRQGVRRA